MEQFTGKVWVLGDDIDTDIIIPTEYLALPTVEGEGSLYIGWMLACLWKIRWKKSLICYTLKTKCYGCRTKQMGDYL